MSTLLLWSAHILPMKTECISRSQPGHLQWELPPLSVLTGVLWRRHQARGRAGLHTQSEQRHLCEEGSTYRQENEPGLEHRTPNTILF